MIWANSVLPVFMAVSGQKTRILREPHFRFQIGDTPRRSETLVTHGLQRFTIQFNRTAVMKPEVLNDYLLTAKSAALAAGEFLRGSGEGAVVESMRRDIKLAEDKKSEQIIFEHLGSNFWLLVNRSG